MPALAAMLIPESPPTHVSIEHANMQLAILRTLPSRLVASSQLSRSLHTAPALLRQTRVQAERGDLPARRQPSGGAPSPFTGPLRVGSLFRCTPRRPSSLAHSNSQHVAARAAPLPAEGASRDSK